MIHELKIREEYFEEILEGRKPYEIRKNDRKYGVGDYLGLNEIDEDGNYTNRTLIVKVLYILDNTEYCKDGFVIMTIAPCGNLETYGIGKTAYPCLLR